MLFYIIWSVWFLSEIILNRFMRSGSTDKKGKDKGTIHIIWIAIGVANTLGILFAIFTSIPILESDSIRYAGLGGIVLGMIIRFYSIASLGNMFTVDVTIRQSHRLKTDGIYTLVRHPSYSGSILSFIGLGLSLNNWVTLFLITVLVIYAMLKRMDTEEKVLLEQFGAEYAAYMQKTKRLIPRIY